MFIEDADVEVKFACHCLGASGVFFDAAFGGPLGNVSVEAGFGVASWAIFAVVVDGVCELGAAGLSRSNGEGCGDRSGD